MCVTNFPQGPWALQLKTCQERAARSADIANETACPGTAPASRALLRPPCAIATQGRNLLFACYPVRLARALLGLDVARMASELGYSKIEWMRIEANLLIMPSELRDRMEEMVRTRLAEDCRL